MAHKTGFTKKSMSQVLQSLGFDAQIKTQEGEVVAILYKGEPPLDAIVDPELIIY
jgi:hypothetical protein